MTGFRSGLLGRRVLREKYPVRLSFELKFSGRQQSEIYTETMILFRAELTRQLFRPWPSSVVLELNVQ